MDISNGAVTEITNPDGTEELPVLHGGVFKKIKSKNMNGRGPAFGYNPGSGRWLSQAAQSTTLTTVGGAANRLELSPWVCPFDMTVDQVGLLASVGVASALGKVVIYDTDESGRPTTLIFESGTIDLSAAAFASAAASPNIALTKGKMYWVGHRHSSTATLNAHQQYTVLSLDYGSTPTASPLKVLRRTLTFATAAPATWTWLATEALSAAPAAVFVRML